MLFLPKFGADFRQHFWVQRNMYCIWFGFKDYKAFFVQLSSNIGNVFPHVFWESFRDIFDGSMFSPYKLLSKHLSKNCLSDFLVLCQ